MDKDTFLNNTSVKDFVRWLAHKSEDGFSHKYCILPKGRRQVNKHWDCSSIYDAYQNYSWGFSYEDRLCGNKRVRGDTFGDSKKRTNRIKELLLQGVHENDEELAFNASCMMLDWGGVLKRGVYSNESKLTDIKKDIGLVEYLRKVKSVLDSDLVAITDDYFVTCLDGSRYPVIMNSGFTKLYSILVDDFVIYDGRVGAALGLLVTKWASDYSGREIPYLLRFSYGNAASSDKCQNNKERRNPSNDKVIFQSLFHGEKEKRRVRHIQDNIKANWVIKEVLRISSENSLFNRLGAPIRAFEAALFMIGGCTHYKCSRNTTGLG